MTTYNGGNGKDTITGGGGDDIIFGGNGVDTLNGGAGNDELHGDNGDDSLRGGAGDDLIDGNNGFDTAYYSGPIDEYSFFTSAGYLNIVHLGGAGADGHDRVIRVERLVFADRTINVGSGTNLPIAGDDNVSTNEDAGTVVSGPGGVLANDYDFDGDPLHVTAGVFVGTYGTLTLNANGTYSYALSAATQALAQGENVVDSFNYVVTDNDGSDTGALVFHIAGVNDAPTAVADAATTGENDVVLINVLANDSDIDHGAILSLAAASAPAGQGTASIVGNQVQFDPGTDFDYLAEGESVVVSVAYTVTDEHGAQSVSNIAITVLGHDDVGITITGTDDGETLTGTTGDDTIDALGGNDTVFAGAGADTVHGGDGDDFLSGQDGNDVIDGGNDNDILAGGDGNDQLSGQAGDDLLFGENGNDILSGGSGNDTISGGNGDDSLDGGDGNDVLSGGAGANVLNGGLGDDQILADSSSGGQTIDGGDGDDFIRLDTRGFASVVTTGAGSDTIELLHADVGTAAVTVTDFTAGAGGDVVQIDGDDGALLDLLSGWDGSSNPFGSGFFRLQQSGADTLLQWDPNGATGGAHWDTLMVFQNTNAASFTADNFTPGFAPDGSTPAGVTITGTGAGETLNGTIGDDVINALGGNDVVSGAAGSDLLDGGDGNDTVSGGDGNDQLLGQAGNDFLDGGNGNDSLSGGDGQDDLVGGLGNDVLAGGNDDDFITGGDGNDSLDGGDGDDTLSDLAGINVFAGGLGDDRIIAGSSSGAQTIDGGDGNDAIVVYYRDFASTVTTGAGSDSIEIAYANVGAAAVTVTDFTTGAGGDLFRLTGDEGALLSLLSGWDTSSNPFAGGFLQLAQSGTDTILQWDQDGSGASFGWETLAVFQNTNVGDFTAANFDPGYDPAGAVLAGETITGTSDDDILVGTAGGDTIEGLAGQDSLFGLAGADLIGGGDGNDNVYGGDGDDVIHGGNGDDSMTGEEGNDQVFGDAGNDSAFGENGNDTLSGGDGADFLSGDAGNDILSGGNDNDNLSGGDGNDTLDGGGGDDLLSGGLGTDVLTGGAGSDIFDFQVASGGADQITDFTHGLDHIQVSASGFGGGLSDGGAVSIISGGTPLATAASGQFLYDTDDGNLYWDADGTGGGAAVLVATFTGAPPLDPTDFVVTF